MYAVRKNCGKGSRKVLVGCEKCSGRLKLKMQVLYTEFRSVGMIPERCLKDPRMVPGRSREV